MFSALLWPMLRRAAMGTWPKHLWTRTDERSNALWGKGGRGSKALVTLATAAVLSSLFVGTAAADGPKSASKAKGAKGSAIAKLRRQFYSISGAAGSLSGADLVKLAKNNHVLSITRDNSLSPTD